MERKPFRHVSLRFNYSNPEHMRLLGIVDSLDPKVYKSKNRFILDAIKYYVEKLEERNLLSWNADSNKSVYVTEERLEEVVSDLKKSIKAEVYEDLLKSVLSSGVNAFHGKCSDTENYEKPDNKPEDLSNYSDVMNKVLNWSEN